MGIFLQHDDDHDNEHGQSWKRPGLRLSRTLVWAGMSIGMCIGCVHCGWGSDTASITTESKANKKSVQSGNTKNRIGRAGGGSPIDSLLPEQANEPTSPDGRALGATPGAKNATVRGMSSQKQTLGLDTGSGQGQDIGIDPQGREIEEVEALADLRRELAEDIQEERRLEKERGAAAQLALGNHDQDAERAGLLAAAGLELNAMGEVEGIEEGEGYYGLDGEAELSSDLADFNTDAQGRDIEEVEALADLRQEIAADIAAEDDTEALTQQALEYELALGGNDQDSGLDPRDVRQEAPEEYEPDSQPLESLESLESTIEANFGSDSDG